MTDRTVSLAAVLEILKTLPPGKEMQKQHRRLTRKVEALPVVDVDAILDLAVDALEECQDELDAYSRQEYPSDHPVHERYRQRDYEANPARIALAALAQIQPPQTKTPGL